jgi:hypothetical protein
LIFGAALIEQAAAKAGAVSSPGLSSKKAE